MTGSRRKRGFLLALCGTFALLFGALGIWQVQRLVWKRALIAQVEARIHSAPVPLPPSAQWPSLDVGALEYLKVEATGTFRHDRETRVDALTALGPGTWLLTPLQTGEGVVLVNRGFLPADDAATPDRPLDEVTIAGLLRASEPGGRLLRPNDPVADRWFARDVEVIAKRRGFDEVAPFFIDAEARPGGSFPVGGLTVVSFRNAHLAYAATWLGLAALCVFGIVLLLRDARAQGFAGR